MSNRYFLQYRLSRASSVSMGSVTSFDDLDNHDDEIGGGEVEGQEQRQSPVRPPRKKKSGSAGSGSASAMSISSTPTSSSLGTKHSSGGGRRAGSVRRSRRYGGSVKRKKSKLGKNNNLRKSTEVAEDGGHTSTYSSSDDDTKDSESRVVASNGDIYTKVWSKYAIPYSQNVTKHYVYYTTGGNATEQKFYEDQPRPSCKPVQPTRSVQRA